MMGLSLGRPAKVIGLMLLLAITMVAAAFATNPLVGRSVVGRSRGGIDRQRR
jgi:hypothetical protein